MSCFFDIATVTTYLHAQDVRIYIKSTPTLHCKSSGEMKNLGRDLKLTRSNLAQIVGQFAFFHAKEYYDRKLGGVMHFLFV